MRLAGGRLFTCTAPKRGDTLSPVMFFVCLLRLIYQSWLPCAQFCCSPNAPSTALADLRGRHSLVRIEILLPSISISNQCKQPDRSIVGIRVDIKERQNRHSKQLPQKQGVNLSRKRAWVQGYMSLYYSIYSTSFATRVITLLLSIGSKRLKIVLR